MAVARHLRYSPRNWLIVDWSAQGRAFGDCGLPKPIPCLTGGESCGAACLHPLPIAEAIDTFDWERWLPEVIVGIDDPDEEIAANYVRQAAIEFCKGARVLQREITVELQPGVNTYPVFPYEGEQIIGVIGVRAPSGPCCTWSQGDNYLAGDSFGTRWRLDVARNEITVPNCSSCGLMHLLVWSAPTEDACVQDVFLYERFRADITLGARRAYVMAVHFRDRALVNSLDPADLFQQKIVLAKNKALRLPSSWLGRPGSLFGHGRGCTREGYYFHRGG